MERLVPVIETYYLHSGPVVRVEQLGPGVTIEYNAEDRAVTVRINKAVADWQLKVVNQFIYDEERDYDYGFDKSGSLDPLGPPTDDNWPNGVR